MTKVSWIEVCCVIQKTSEKEFQYPYQGIILKNKQSFLGFNRLFYKDPASYSYIPVFNLKNTSGKLLIKELFRKMKLRLMNKKN